ncbi:hypothetical protein HanOQP8_Chr01g0030741 [Helianthus annuus]|nr:hypothetical protein HanOQP8_Chr01g0030741 [Helianthus annuus]
MMESIISTWQLSFLFGVFTWIVASSMFNVTHKVRSFVQPWVSRRVISGTPTILQIQIGDSSIVWIYDKFDCYVCWVCCINVNNFRHIYVIDLVNCFVFCCEFLWPQLGVA